MKRLLVSILILVFLSPNVLAGCLGLQSPYTQRFVKAADLPGGCLNTCFDPQTDVVSVCGSKPGPKPPTPPPKPPPKRITPKSPDAYVKESTDYANSCLDVEGKALGISWSSVKKIKQTCDNAQDSQIAKFLSKSKACKDQCDEIGFLYKKDCTWFCTAHNRRYNAWSDKAPANKIVSDWEASLDLPECKETCSDWSPLACRGGYQLRTCSNTCPTPNREPNRRLCTNSQMGYLNLPARGSYLHEDPKTGLQVISTKGEYHAEANAYIGETDGKLYLVDTNGKHIQGVGLHVGEATKLQVNAPVRPDIPRFGTIPEGGYTARVNGINADIRQTNRGFNIEFKIPPSTEQKEFNLELLRDGNVVETIPLKADIQPATKDLLKQEKKTVVVDPDDDQKEKEKWFIIMALLSSMIILAAFMIIAGTIIYFIFRKKK
ncbi:MAG: hypothetical protein ACE5FT_03000 [Candidatus Nanoarchaeia archaeon]